MSAIQSRKLGFATRQLHAGYSPDLGAGAYGFVQSSNYNSRDRAPEVLVDGASFHVVRSRETLRDQLDLESLPKEAGR